MPRQPPSRPPAELVFPREDGASGSTARDDVVPQFLAPSDSHPAMAQQRQLQQQQQRLRGAALGTVASISSSHGAGGGNARDMHGGPDDISDGDDDGLEDFDEDVGEDDDDDDDGDDDEEGEHEEHEDNQEDEEEDEDEEDEDAMEEDAGRFTSAPIPPNLREISSLASWTVSTHKPGSGVAALRNPSPSLYWQSDGPQPHTLTLHFFKRVAIVRMRVYLDFELDESYTPTKMVFLGGMGGNDLVEFASWQGEAPCGWVDISLDGVGGSFTRARTRKKVGKRKPRRRQQLADSEGEDEDGAHGDGRGGNGIPPATTGHNGGVSDVDDENEENDDDDDDYDLEEDIDIDIDDPSAGNVLKAMVVQVRVCENHQNGKDTHVRGFQVFARDDRYFSRTRHHHGHRNNKSSIRAASGGSGATKKLDAGGLEGFVEPEETNGVALAKFDEADWMQEPEIR